jgi:hypothetical protein
MWHAYEGAQLAAAVSTASALLLLAASSLQLFSSVSCESDVVQCAAVGSAVDTTAGVHSCSTAVGLAASLLSACAANECRMSVAERVSLTTRVLHSTRSNANLQRNSAQLLVWLDYPAL